MKKSKLEVCLTRKEVDVHAVLHHGRVGPRLVKIGSHSVGSVATLELGSLASLFQGLSNLSLVILVIVGVRVDDDDFSNVLLAISSIGLRRIRSFSQLAAVVWGPCMWMAAAGPPVTMETEASTTSSTCQSVGAPRGEVDPNGAARGAFVHAGERHHEAGGNHQPGLLWVNHGQ